MSGVFPRLQALPYRSDTSIFFEALRHLPWPVFLDSGGRADLDIVAADPSVQLTTRGESTRIRRRRGESISALDPFDLIREALGPEADGTTGLPYEGGAIGYFGYDLARRLERLPKLARDPDGLPDMCIGIYDWAIVVDHGKHQAWLVGQGRDAETARNWDRLVDMLSTPRQADALRPFRAAGTVDRSLSWSEYLTRFERIQAYIRDGDCYQVNFAQRFDLPVTGEPWAGYQSIRSLNPSPFSAFLAYDDFSVLSFSPERFLWQHDGLVETKPIKGTRPRGTTAEQDAELIRALRESAKDQAENLMIVDLLRNDLGRVCVPGSIGVPRLFEVESFATVHHLVSTVVGTLRPDEDALSLLRACFPGGSITGAPKIRAMQIIEELEPQRRGVYCGAIGRIGYDGGMDTSIVIRTLMTRGDRAWFYAGGGIVADSTAEAEYQECLSKAGFFLDYFKGF